MEKRERERENLSINLILKRNEIVMHGLSVILYYGGIADDDGGVSV